MYARPQRSSHLSDASADQAASAAVNGSGNGFRVRVVLSQPAQAFVLQSGLGGRLALLADRADVLHPAMQQGDRVALSDSTRHDLLVLRRRVLVEPPTLEIILDLIPDRI
ncbi:hypothetical protein ACLBXM_05965 [Xanthobacteraceae bacterium A53D]